MYFLGIEILLDISVNFSMNFLFVAHFYHDEQRFALIHPSNFYIIAQWLIPKFLSKKTTR